MTICLTLSVGSHFRTQSDTTCNVLRSDLYFSEETRLEDNGGSFVNALESHQSSFGSLTFKYIMSLEDFNLGRLLKVERIEKLELHIKETRVQTARSRNRALFSQKCGTRAVCSRL